jgi:glycerol-3-phosphate O-acyltransferase
LRIFYSGIKDDKSQLEVIKEIPKNAIIIFASQYKSYFEFFYFYSRYQKEKIPFPQVGLNYRVYFFQPVLRIFQIFLANISYLIRFQKLLDPYESGYIKEILCDGKAGMLPLIEERGFYKRFVKSKTDPIRYLVEMQTEIDRPVIIVPQLMFFTKKPPRLVPSLIDILFGPEHKPGRLRRIVSLFKKPEKIFISTSSPLNLKSYLENPANHELSFEQISVVLRRKLQEQMSRHRQSITGPSLKPLPELKENILTRKELRFFMKQYAEKRGIPLYKVHKKADAYIDEIASDFNLGLLKIGEVTVRWFCNIMFEDVIVNYDMLNKIRNEFHKGSLILVPCHKSHIDYLMLSYIMYTHKMPCPQIAAGKNLSFWPLGPLFRGGGAFFIRRTFRGAVLYSKVFKEYIYKILQEGFNVEFFIEGGRSRTGKLLMPKLGLLSIIIDAFKNGACNDLIFVPIFIGYDRVLEESAYLREIEGGKKKEENLVQVIKAGKFLRKHYGKIYIKFQEPISLNEHLQKKGKTIRELTSKEQNLLCREMGYRIINGIDQASVVTPHAVVAGAILNIGRENFSYEALMSLVDTYMTYLMSRDIPLADTILYENVYAFEHALNSYISRKFVEKIPQNPVSKNPDIGETDSLSSDILYRVVENKRVNLEYYKNNSICFFIPAAYTALSILDTDAFQFCASDIHHRYIFLQELFQNEFVQNVDIPPERYVRKTIKSFIDEAILMPHPTLPDCYNLTSAGFRKLKSFASFLKTYLESYWVVLNYLKRYPKDTGSPKDKIKKIQSSGNKMYKQKLISQPESLSRMYFINGVDFFVSHGIKGAEDIEKIEYYGESIHRYLHRLSV